MQGKRNITFQGEHPQPIPTLSSCKSYPADKIRAFNTQHVALCSCWCHIYTKKQNNQRGLTYINKTQTDIFPCSHLSHPFSKTQIHREALERSQTSKMPEIARGMHLAQAVCHSSHVLVTLTPSFKTTTYGASICAFWASSPSFWSSTACYLRRWLCLTQIVWPSCQ